MLKVMTAMEWVMAATGGVYDRHEWLYDRLEACYDRHGRVYDRLKEFCLIQINIE